MVTDLLAMSANAATICKEGVVTDLLALPANAATQERVIAPLKYNVAALAGCARGPVSRQCQGVGYYPVLYVAAL